jgi:vitamin B12 transporter
VRLGWLTEYGSPGRIRLKAGADLEYEDGSNDSTLRLPPAWGGDVSASYRQSRTTPGAFAELVMERRGVLIEAGLRADLPQGLATEWSPRIGVRSLLADGKITLRGTLSRAFKLPSFYVLGSPSQLGGNPDLKAEKSWGGDVGIEHAAGAWHVRAGLFYNRFTDLIDFDFDSFSHVNRSRVDSRGVELSLEWTPDPRLDVTADVTWQDVENVGTPAPVLNQPEWLTSARLTWRPRTALTVGLQARHVSGSHDRQIPVPDRDVVRGHVVLDTGVEWNLSEDWQVRGRLDNVTDADYESFIGFPGPGLSARIALRYTLQ